MDQKIIKNNIQRKREVFMSWMDKYKKCKKDFNKKDYHGEDPSEVNEYDEYDEYEEHQDKDNDDETKE